MQKLIQRRLAAERQALRRAQQQAAKNDNAHEFNTRWQLQGRQRANSIYFLEEKKRRRDEYHTGPRLAPRRDTGSLADKYGTVEPSIIQAPRQHWSTYRHWKCIFAEGDRVLITKGRDEGKIATVTDVVLEAGVLRVDKLRQVDFYVPEYMRNEYQDQRSVVPQALPIPWEDCKLVYPIRDQTTGHFEDVVLDKVDLRNAGWKEDNDGRRYVMGQRFVPGIKTPLPWPKKEEAQKHQGYDDDTLRITVDDVTARPYLLQPPMPPSVIDELRNKYSVFRSRHEPEYIAAKEAQDLAAKRKEQLAALVSTPMAELKEKRRQELLANPPTLTDDQLAKIGEVMAREKAAAINEVAQQGQ